MRFTGTLFALGLIGAIAVLSACSSAEPTARIVAPTARPAAQPTATAASTPGPLIPFTLPRSGGGELSLADYIGKQPVSVVFYRGFF